MAISVIVTVIRISEPPATGISIFRGRSSLGDGAEMCLVSRTARTSQLLLYTTNKGASPTTTPALLQTRTGDIHAMLLEIHRRQHSTSGWTTAQCLLEDDMDWDSCDLASTGTGCQMMRLDRGPVSSLHHLLHQRRVHGRMTEPALILDAKAQIWPC